jgi:membrane protease subunit HflK
MVDSQSGGNMMYLPLDKILERQNTVKPGTDVRNTIEGLRAVDQDNQNSSTATGNARGERFRTGRN